jgi:uncharacterized membrane protein
MVVPLLIGLVLFAASLTPSLIPRGAVLQGVLGGVVMAVGYGMGRFGLWVLVLLEVPPPPRGRRALWLRVGLAVPVAALVLWALLRVGVWQNSIRAAMEMPPVTEGRGLWIALVAAAVFAVLMLLGWAVQALFDFVRSRLARDMPERVANLLGAVTAALLLIAVTSDGLLRLALGAADQAMAASEAFHDPEIAPPEGPLVPGGPGSLLDWQAMGRWGREFATAGPSARDIAALTGRPAKDPLRIYVGREQAPTPEARAAAALAEMERVGAFDRAVLVVAMPTGTGWLDPGAHDTLEHLLHGDVATVTAQYSYLTSPLALLVESDTGLAQSDALLDAVYERWSAMPRDARPRLYLHGLSLGAWASMSAFDLFEMVGDPVDGALWAGPPFPSALWQRSVARREEGSPYVRPVVGEGELVRFMDQWSGEAEPAEGWGPMRVVFLQYASDAIVFYEPEALWRPPVWMEERTAPDVSPRIEWFPLVTMLQLALDMAIATSVPQGYGHNYTAEDYVDAWLAVVDPPGWDAGAIARLKANCGGEWGFGCRR